MLISADYTGPAIGSLLKLYRSSPRSPFKFPSGAGLRDQGITSIWLAYEPLGSFGFAAKKVRLKTQKSVWGVFYGP
jgi:hypothetical protein